MEEIQPSEISYDEGDNEEDRLVGEDPPKEQGTSNLKLATVTLSYIDMFEYLVDQSKKLSKVVKFHQLRSHLKGNALDCIRGYKVTSANYDAAWADLKKRYDRTEELIEEYIRKFLEASAIRHRATHWNLRAIIDATNQMFHALPGLGTKIENWDPFINFIVKTKIDEETRSEWRQKQVKEKLVKTTDLLDFLENRASELQPAQSQHLSQMLNNESKRKFNKKIFQVTEKKGGKANVHYVMENITLKTAISLEERQ